MAPWSRWSRFSGHLNLALQKPALRLTIRKLRGGDLGAKWWSVVPENLHLKRFWRYHLGGSCCESSSSWSGFVFAVRSSTFHFVPPPPILFTGIVEFKASCLLSAAKGSTRYEMKMEPCDQMWSNSNQHHERSLGPDEGHWGKLRSTRTGTCIFKATCKEFGKEDFSFNILWITSFWSQPKCCSMASLLVERLSERV